MLPSAAREALTRHLEDVRRLHERDLAKGFGRVVLPCALDRKFPNAPTEWRWRPGAPASRCVDDHDDHDLSSRDAPRRTGRQKPYGSAVTK